MGLYLYSILHILLLFWDTIFLSRAEDTYDEGEDTAADLEGVEQLRDGNYQLRLPIPSQLFKHIIGKEGRTKKAIERDTECQLAIPSRGREGDVGEH